MNRPLTLEFRNEPPEAGERGLMPLRFSSFQNWKVFRVQVFCLWAGLFVQSCATIPGSPSNPATSARGRDGNPVTISDILRQSPDATSTSSEGGGVRLGPGQSPRIEVRGVVLKNTQFDIPVTVNSAVEQWVDYFTGRGRKHFERYLERSEYFIPYIHPILREHSMPEDLVYLSMIESGFNNLARSRAKAVGPWQFMSFTGKKYGLAVNWWVDERRDIQKSTVAAINYLRDLYSMFGSWELAASAYNAGEGKIARAIQRYGSKDFWVLVKGRYLKPETRNYVPKMIAAALVAKNREQFGFAAPPVPHPAADEAVAGDGEIVKVIKTDKPEQDMDPEDAAQIAAVHAAAANVAKDESRATASSEEEGSAIVPATLTVPVYKSKDPGAVPLVRAIPTPHVNKKGEVDGIQLSEFEIQSPADLLQIAKAAGISYHTVKALNPELVRWVTPPTNTTYRVKLPSSSKEKFLETYNHEAFPRKVEFMAYTVRQGDNLMKISRRFGIKVEPIAELNGLSPRVALRKGSKIFLPIPNDRSRSLASLEVRDAPERVARRSRSKSVRYYKITYKKRESARPRSKRDGRT